MSRPVRRYCRSCGAEAPERGRFCPSCGSSLNQTSPYPAPDGIRRGREPQDGASRRDPVADLYPALSTSPAVVTPTVAGSVRMGFGIALGMLLFSVVLAVVFLVALAVASGVLTWPFAEAGQRFEGRGPADSVPLTFDGDVRVEWTASPISPVACRFAASLMAQNDLGINFAIANTMVDTQQGSGTPRAFQLERRSDYYIRVNSDCEWSIRVLVD